MGSVEPKVATYVEFAENLGMEPIGNVNSPAWWNQLGTVMNLFFWTWQAVERFFAPPKKLTWPMAKL